MIILDKKEYCKNILKEKGRKITKSDIVLLSRYFFSLNYDEVQVYKKLKKYILSNVKEYNSKIYDDYIDRAIIVGKFFKLEDNLKIVITKKELDSILFIKDFDTQKFMFSMLVLAKYFKYGNNRISKSDYDGLYCKCSFKDIKEIAKINASVKKMREMCHELFKIGYIIPSLLGGWRIMIEDTESNDETENYYIVPDNDMIYFLYSFKGLGRKIYQCSCCGKWKKGKTSWEKTCDSCNKEKSLERVRNFRMKQNKTEE